MKINKENFIIIQGWMLTELKLKGNELIVYSCIFGFSQAENQVFNGSLQYLADWTNSTKQGVLKNLKSLEEKGYIVKNEKYINGVKFCEYYATKFNGVLNNVEQGIKQSLTDCIKQSLHNNIDTNNIKNKKENTIETLFEKFWKDYPKKIAKEYAFRCFEKLNPTEELLNLILNKLKKQKVWKGWNDTRFIPNPSTYINQRRWEDEIPDNEISSFEAEEFFEEALARSYAEME